MINQQSIELIKLFEGCKLKAYQDIAGVWTIGFGHTSAAGAPHVTPDLAITDTGAHKLLKSDLVKYEAAVDRAVKPKISANQRGALVSLCYNIGLDAFVKSTCVKRINVGDMQGAAEALTWWNKAGGEVVKGLVRRREAERKLFVSDIEMIDEGQGGIVEGGAAKPLVKSKTTWLGGLTLAGSLGTLSEVRSAVPEVAQYLPYVLVIVGALIVFNRWNEHRQGIH